MDILSSYTYDENFKPLIEARYDKTIPEFVEMYGSALTQTQALSFIRNNTDKDAVVVAASGSLPGDMQRMWTSESLYTYNMEYGYSCMGYEISGAFGAKLEAKLKNGEKIIISRQYVPELKRKLGLEEGGK